MRIRELDWSRISLGAPGSLNEHLKCAVQMMLDCPELALLVVGPDRTLLYNDRASVEFSSSHPAALGQPCAAFLRKRHAWLADQYDLVFKGEHVGVSEQPVFSDRVRALEIFDASFTPIRDDNGTVIAAYAVLRPASERIRAERVLRESEARHRLLVESWAQAVWEADADGTVVTDSPSWRAYTGQTLSEWLGYGWLDAIHPDDQAHAESNWRAAVAGRSKLDSQFRIRAADGTWRWTNVRATPLLDVSGEIEKWVGMNFDIDAKKQTEAALKNSEELRRLALDGGGMGVWVWDKQSDLVQTDETAQRLVGAWQGDKQHPASIYSDLIDTDGGVWLAEVIDKKFKPGEEFHAQFRVSQGPCEGRWIEIRGRAEQERAWIVNGVVFDVTRQRLAEQRITESEALLRTVAEVIEDVFYVTDVDTGGLVYLSPGYEQLWGRPSEELRRDLSKFIETIHPDDRPAVVAWKEQQERGEAVSSEYRIVRPDGQTRWILDRCFPVPNASRRLSAGVASDITDRRQA